MREAQNWQVFDISRKEDKTIASRIKLTKWQKEYLQCKEIAQMVEI